MNTTMNLNKKQRYSSVDSVKEHFLQPELFQDVYGAHWGFTNPVGEIKHVLMHRPAKEVLTLNKARYKLEAGSLLLHNIKGQHHNGGENKSIDLAKLQEQHDQLTGILRKFGVHITELQGQSELMPDRLFTHDLGMVIPGGIILSRFAIYTRYPETRLALQTLSGLGMPILGMIQGYGYVEGGSFALLNDKTAVVGRSERVNQEGIQQLQQLLSFQGIELITVELASHKIHIDEAFLMLDRDKALVDLNLLPYWFINRLQSMGIQLFCVNKQDPELTINALAIAPGKVLFPSTGSRTMELLSNNGIEVIPVDVSEIVKLGGGIHCAILPLIRA